MFSRIAAILFAFFIGLSFPVFAAPPDDDGDGLSNNEENNTYFTDPLNPDTDGDGLTDGDEVLTQGTNPLLADTDGDGLTDGDEVLVHGTDPTVPDPDTDSDGLYDFQETGTYGTNPSDPDSDGDSLLDGDEVLVYFSDPLSADSDADGMPDGWEVNNGLDLNLNDASGDADADGLNNGDEYLAGTDPGDSDSDGDTLSDGDEVLVYSSDPLAVDSDNDTWSDYWEVTNGTNPAVDDRTDVDGDGRVLHEEILAGSDPTNANSRPYWSRTVNIHHWFRSFAIAGDLNNDGYQDFVIGNDYDSSVDTENGVVRAISGNDFSELYSVYGVLNDRLGEEVAATGDLNGDGYEDFLAVATGNDYVRVYSGNDGSVLYNHVGEFAASGVGDVNNDGYMDFAAASISGDVFVNVYSGSDSTVIHTINISSLNIIDGVSATAAAGDINLDGYDDFMVALASNIQSEPVRIFSGYDASLIYEKPYWQLQEMWGNQLGAAGDVNNDGYPDFYSTAPENDWPTGAVRIGSGADGSWIHVDVGNKASRAGDLNADGYDDYLTINFSSSNQKINVKSGANTNVLNTLYPDGLINNPSYDEGYGNVFGGYDLDNDGIPDIVGTADRADLAGDITSSFRIILGADLINDQDMDGAVDSVDNCVSVRNAGQLDTDGDSEGDVCDLDDDGDGWSDDDEGICGSDPLNNGSVPLDTDGDLECDVVDLDDDNDGLTDAEEVALGTWVKNPDTDSDGMTDGWEVDNGLDPKANDASGDPDADGYTNLQEFINGTDPNVFDDPPEINSVKADTDNDGDADILWQNTTDGTIVIWHQQNFAKAGETTVGGLGVNYVLADTADLDADGDSDLILFDGDPSAGLALRWEIENHAKVSGAKLAGFPGWQFKGTGDFDGDGDGDIVWQSENGLAASDGTVIVWIMENNAKVSGSSLGRHEFGARVVAIGDFDNDADADIMQSIPSAPSLIRWDFENGSKVAGASIGGFVGYTVKAVGDFNNDATADLLWEPDAAGQAIMWLMQNGSKSSGTGVGLLTNYDIETVADYDGDGDADVLWKNANGHVIIWDIENAAKTSGYSLDIFDADHDVKP